MDYRYLENGKLKANVKALPTMEYLHNVMQSCLEIISYYHSKGYDDDFINELNFSLEKNRAEERKMIIDEVLS